MVEGCTAGQRMQLDFGNGPKPSFDLAEVWRANGSIVEFNFPVSNHQCGNIKLILVDGNGNPTDSVNIDCGKLFVFAQVVVCIIC